MKNHHSKSKTKCDKCGLELATNYGLLRHLTVIHTNSEEAHYCTKSNCNKKFNNKYNAKVHNARCKADQKAPPTSSKMVTKPILDLGLAWGRVVCLLQAEGTRLNLVELPVRDMSGETTEFRARMFAPLPLPFPCTDVYPSPLQPGLVALASSHSLLLLDIDPSSGLARRRKQLPSSYLPPSSYTVAWAPGHPTLLATLSSCSLSLLLTSGSLLATLRLGLSLAACTLTDTHLYLLTEQGGLHIAPLPAQLTRQAVLEPQQLVSDGQTEGAGLAWLEGAQLLVASYLGGLVQVLDPRGRLVHSLQALATVSKFRVVASGPGQGEGLVAWLGDGRSLVLTMSQEGFPSLYTLSRGVARVAGLEVQGQNVEVVQLEETNLCKSDLFLARVGVVKTRPRLCAVFCGVCGAVMGSSWIFKRHMTLHQNVSTKCSVCECTFQDSIELKNHKVKCFLTCSALEPYFLCVYKSKSRKRLDTHMKIHKQTKYKCGMCDFKSEYYKLFRKHTYFSHKSDNTHMNIHKQKKYKCGMCDFKSEHYKLFRKHTYFSHKSDIIAEKNVDNQASFTNQNNRKLSCEIKMENIIYDEKVDGVEIFQLECEFCGDEMQSNSALNNHMSLFHSNIQKP